MRFLSGFFSAVSIFASILSVPAVAQDVAVDSDITVISRQGILPVRISCTDVPVKAVAQLALGLHGAFDLRAKSSLSAILKIEKSASGLSASCEGSNKPFAGTLSVTGTAEADVLKLCDKIVVAVGKTYNWNLKPIFSTTKLAFSSTRTGSREIYTSNILVRGVKQVTNLKSFSAMPHWDPAGTRIFFTTYKYSGGADVSYVDLRSGSIPARPFAGYKNTNNGGSVSPDGMHVALALSVRGPMDIYVAPASGGSPKILVKSPEVKTSPAWSPDGKTIVFAAGATGSPRLYTVPAAGGQPRKLPVELSCYAAEPDWSKTNPTKIAFSYIGRGRNSVAVHDTRSGKTKDIGLLLSGRKISNPTWCADGRHIVAVEESGKNSFLVLIDTEPDSRAKITRISPPLFKDCFDPDALTTK